MHAYTCMYMLTCHSFNVFLALGWIPQKQSEVIRSRHHPLRLIALGQGTINISAMIHIFIGYAGNPGISHPKSEFPSRDFCGSAYIERSSTKKTILHVHVHVHTLLLLL